MRDHSLGLYLALSADQWMRPQRPRMSALGISVPDTITTS